MKSIGLIGGISWHATIKYYEYINRAINKHFGNNTNPPLLIYNVNQSKMHEYQQQDDWKSISNMIYEGAKSLKRGGASVLLICSNTTHKVYQNVASKVNTPVLHIADETAKEVIKAGLNKVGFIGTKFTMQNSFLTDRIKTFGIDVLIPEQPEHIEELHRIIHEELTYNKIERNSKQFVLNQIEQMKSKGAQGIILGCTEYPLMIRNSDLVIPVFNTIEIHAQSAVNNILEGIYV